MWSYVVGETREPGENHRPLTGDHNPATCPYPGSNPGRSDGKRVFYHYAIQAPTLYPYDTYIPIINITHLILHRSDQRILAVLPPPPHLSHTAPRYSPSPEPMVQYTCILTFGSSISPIFFFIILTRGSSPCSKSAISSKECRV